MPLFYLLLSCLIGAALPLSLSAQILVANISQGNAGSNPSNLQSDGEYTVFVGNNGTTEQLYYQATGIAEPSPIGDLVPDLTMNWTNSPTLIAGSVYFVVDAQGTIAYQRIDLATGEVSEIGIFPSNYFDNNNPWYTAVNGAIVFIHPDDNYDKQLYRYDPTDESLTLLQQMPEGYVSRIGRIGNRVFFDYGYSPGDPVPFVVTDGTKEGTLVRYPLEGAEYVEPLIAVGSRTVVQAIIGRSAGPYVYDENFYNALPLREVYPSIPPGTVRHLSLHSDGLYFSLQTPELDLTIYRLDTATSTVEPVLDVNPNRDSIYLQTLQFFPDQIFYTSIKTNNGRQTNALYGTDGTTEPSLLLDNITNRGFNGYSLGEIVASDGYYYFLADQPGIGTELWRTDGSPSGTRLLADFYPGPSSPEFSEPVPTGNGIVLTAIHPEYGEEVFTVENGSESIELLMDVNTRETGSIPQPQAIVNGRLLFRATTPCTGFELFATQGSAATTGLVADLEAGREGSHPTVTTTLGDTAFVNVSNFNDARLYGTDGTPGGTFQLDPEGPVGRAIISGPVRLGSRLLLRTYVSGVGQVLYSIDPPSGAYELIKVLEPTFGANSSGQAFVALNDSILLFEETTRAYGTELWRTDGTAEGTFLVKDIRQVEEDGFYGHIGNLTVIDGLAFFTADYGQGRLPFRSDGTEEGTFELTGFGNLQNPSLAFAYGGQVYFTAGGYGSRALYTTKGAPFDVEPSPITASSGYVSISNLRVLGDGLVFTADQSGTGEKLWATAGPGMAAVPLQNAQTGTSPTSPRDLFVVNDTLLLFSADVPELGRELWKTDGTVDGTVLVADIQAGPASSDPEYFYAFDGFVYFSADDGKVGAELWKYAPDGIYPEDTDPNAVQVACAAPPTSSTEIPELEIRTYPNPANDWLRVELHAERTVAASLHDLSGQTVYASDRTADRFTIPLHDFPAGAYTLLLWERSGEIVGRRRIIVTR
ncbi:T9SS type A sorting domain-containing protein [Lewinella sp. IMCC34191]|uniref:T9SS type A sorting domain-containing protein n=1 Tax=Lewinella sp. IMCC34191 TaxID=2259172 RepID=UPI000E242D67|nr:T9SS type A sorting domain-containing protein [Lewinella sp. IMCC34191]